MHLWKHIWMLASIKYDLTNYLKQVWPAFLALRASHQHPHIASRHLPKTLKEKSQRSFNRKGMTRALMDHTLVRQGISLWELPQGALSDTHHLCESKCTGKQVLTGNSDFLQGAQQLHPSLPLPTPFSPSAPKPLLLTGHSAAGILTTHSPWQIRNQTDCNYLALYKAHKTFYIDSYCITFSSQHMAIKNI